MKTIEERAARNSVKLSIEFGINQKMTKALYIAIAKEQRAIDIDRAIEWLEMNLEYWLCDNDLHIIPEVIKDFRKAMEDEK